MERKCQCPDCTYSRKIEVLYLDAVNTLSVQPRLDFSGDFAKAAFNLKIGNQNLHEWAEDARWMYSLAVKVHSSIPHLNFTPTYCSKTRFIGLLWSVARAEHEGFSKLEFSRHIKVLSERQAIEDDLSEILDRFEQLLEEYARGAEKKACDRQ
jgi:hypothetical protein